MSRCSMERMLKSGSTPVAMLYVSLFNGKDAKVRVYSCSHAICLAVQSRGLIAKVRVYSCSHAICLAVQSRGLIAKVRVYSCSHAMSRCSE